MLVVHSPSLCIVSNRLCVWMCPGAGQWTRENCRVVSESDDNCRCECSQLGHFGLLFVRMSSYYSIFSYVVVLEMLIG